MKLFIIVCATLSLAVAIAAVEQNDPSQFQKTYLKPSSIQNTKQIKGKYDLLATDKQEYFFLSDLDGKVIIIDAISYDQVISFDLPEISLSILAIVGDTFFNIDTLNGTILSTPVGNLLQGPDYINWAHAGSFPVESNWIRNSVAVDGIFIYFVTDGGIFYEYDTILRTVTVLGNVRAERDPYASLIILNKIIYIYKYYSFYFFDGTNLATIATPQEKHYPGLFPIGNNVCRLGGNITNVNPDPVTCYNPVNKTWSEVRPIKEARRCVGIVTRESKTYVFGGYALFSGSNEKFWRNLVNVYNHETNVWSYLPTPLTEGQQYVQAILFSY